MTMADGSTGTIKSYSRRLYEISGRFEGTRYQKLAEQISHAYLESDFKRFDELYEQLPTDIELLESLVDKLKGKSVYSNLRKILRNEPIEQIDSAIAISSLYTHVLIESKKHSEFKVLLPGLFKKLGTLS